MSKILQIIITVLATTSLTFAAYATENKKETEVVVITEEAVINEVVIEEPIEDVEVVEEMVIEEPVEEPVEEIVEEPQLAQSDVELIALITMAEAEGEPEEGKRLVIDAILNRVDHARFPNTIHDVIYQKNQFTCTTNGRVNRCRVTEENCNLVREEMVNRTNYDVIFFTANRYGKYGQPMFSVGNHYFSSY